MDRLRFDSAGVVADPSLVLMTKSDKRLGSVVGFENFHYKHHLNQADEISLTVHKFIDGVRNPLWDSFVSLKVLWYQDANQCFELDVDATEDDDIVKQVTGKALAESELAQILLFDTEINTEDDIAREDYTSPTVFYNADNPNISLLNRILNKAPHYQIAHVDGSLTTLQRTFSFDNTSVVDALNDVAEEVKCLFQYDASIDADTGKIVRSISAYDLMRSCRDCGKRFEGDACPKCGSTDFNEGYGVSTGIVVAKDNLADNIDFESDTDSVKNCFRLEGGDDDFTAVIRACNPNGTNYIWNITDDTKSDMTDQLVSKIDSYDALYQEYATTRKFSANTAAYNAIVDKYISRNPDLRHIYSGDSSEATTQDIKLVGVSSLVDAEYTILDLSAYLQTSMMPTYNYTVPSAQEQCNTIQNSITTISVTNANNASSETVALAIKSLAKIYAHTEIYDVTVTTSSYASRSWKGVVTLTNFSDDTDTASTRRMTVAVSSSATNYAADLVQKKVNEYKNTAYDISALFNMSLTNFKTAIKGYSLDCLKSFTECCQACISVLVDQGAGASGASAHSIYTAYYNKLKALESEITVRSKELATVGTFDNRTGLLQTIINLINKVHKVLDFESYLGTDLWNEFIVYRREQEYSNSNYRSDGLTNAEMIQNARGFYEAAEAELYKASQLQHSISAPLKNLLAMSEFEGLTDNFEVGNWIYVIVDEKPYKLRLVAYEINFDDIQNIDVEFSDLLAIKNGVSDLKSVIDSQKSMASSYGMVYKQAAKGDSANREINDFYATGINGAKVRIMSNETSQDMQFGDSGLLGREWIDEEARYSLEQCRLTNKTLAFTSDGWETSNAAIGKIVVDGVEKYGMIADAIVAGTLDASNVTVENLSADSITSGSLTVTDRNGNVIFSADKTNRSVTMGGWTAKNGYLSSTNATTGAELKLGDGQISGTEVCLLGDNGEQMPTLGFYPSGGSTPMLSMYSTGSSMQGYYATIAAATDLRLLSSKALILATGGGVGPAGYAGIVAMDTLIPAYTNSFSLGTNDLRWNWIHANTVMINGYSAIAHRIKNVTGTTSTSGNLNLSLSNDDYVVIGVQRTDAVSICHPYINASGAWLAHLTTSAASPAVVASTAVTLEVYYYAK